MTRLFFSLGAMGAALLALTGRPACLRAQESRLFTSHDPVTLTIRAPLEDIFEHRGDDSREYAGEVVIHRPSTGADTVDVDIRTRGHSRLQRRICRFPPLRLDFPTGRVVGSLFQGQDKLKLVTHCQDREGYEQYVLLEYLAYRVYNTLTPLSFRVRLAHITYEDSGGHRDTVTRYGFLIEHEEAVAERTGWSYLAAPRVPPRMMDPENIALLPLFQYMIGNPDWSAFQPGPGSSECCHNTKPIGGLAGPVFSVPHDFDLSGLVDTRYAEELYGGNLQKIGRTTVRERFFRGLCRSAPLWPDVFARFHERRGEIERLFRSQEGLEEGTVERALEYLGSFYDVINDEERVRRELGRTCVDERS